MPRGNVEVVRKALEAFEQRDAETLRTLFDVDGEFRSAIMGQVEGGAYRGHDDIERYLADLDETFEYWHTEDERILDVGAGKVVALYRIVGNGKGSGVPIDQPVGIVFTVLEGRIVLGEGFPSSQGAMKAGLEHAFESFGRGDIDAAVDNVDPDIEWEHYLGSGAPEEGIYRGRDELRALLLRLRESWEDIRVDAREVSERGENEFVVESIIHAKGRSSELELQSACEYAIKFREGKAVRVRFALTGPAPRTTSSATADRSGGARADVG
jgi:ketosteroid isomerase-like protein